MPMRCSLGTRVLPAEELRAGEVVDFDAAVETKVSMY